MRNMPRLSISFILVLVLCIVLVSSSSYAWTSYTHNWICDRAGLIDLDCANADYKDMQSKYHDLAPVHHHCADNATDCAARVYAEKFYLLDTNETLEFAAHLYADSMVPVHWYSTDYDTCHKIFEDKVEEKLRKAENVKYDLFKSSYDFSVWNVTMQCQAKFGKENKTVIVYADNMYMDSVAKYVADRMHVEYRTATIKTYDLTPIVYLALAFLVIIFAIFIYFGLKNREDMKKIKKKH